MFFAGLGKNEREKGNNLWTDTGTYVESPSRDGGSDRFFDDGRLESVIVKKGNVSQDPKYCIRTTRTLPTHGPVRTS